MNQSYETLKTYLERVYAIDAAIRLFEWDCETLAPKGGAENTAKIIGSLCSQYQEALIHPNLQQLVDSLKSGEGLTEAQKAVVRETGITIDKLKAVPAREYEEYSALKARAGRIWAQSRKMKDFEQYAPTLKNIISFQKKFAGYRTQEGQSLYETMIQDYEPGFDLKMLDEFFLKLKDNLVPLLKKVTESKKVIDNSFLTGDFDPEKQRQLADWLVGYLNMDGERSVLAVSEHPFTTSIHNRDVRITTHFTHNLTSSVYSVIHEAGHGLYELGIQDDLAMTLAGDGASMGMHESQSRFFENIVGKNRAFLGPVFEKICQLFPDQMKGITLEQFWEGVNKVEPGPIRIEADELTYSLHILIRYELEKSLIDGDLSVEELPEEWNKKYREYLLVDPVDDGVGVLQDVHWSQGDFGYFPSYALGNAFGAQLYHHMCRELDFEGLLKAGNLEVMIQYLRTRLHQYGKMKTSLSLIREITGEEFNPIYYIQYLNDKYKNLYWES